MEVALIATATIVDVAIDVRPNAFSGDAVIALPAMAMGVRNATVRRLAISDLTTTVLTMTLTGLAADAPPGGSGKGSARRIAAVPAMLIGALAGALLLNVSLFLSLAVAAGLALLTWLIYVPAARRHVLNPGGVGGADGGGRA